MKIAVLLVSLLVTVFALPLPSDHFDDADNDSVVIDEDGQNDEEMPSLQADKDEAGATPGNEGEDPDVETPDVETPDDAQTFVDDSIAAKDAEPAADKDDDDSDDVEGENTNEAADENSENLEKKDEAETVLPLNNEGETEVPDATEEEDGETTEESDGVEV